MEEEEEEGKSLLGPDRLVCLHHRNPIYGADNTPWGSCFISFGFRTRRENLALFLHSIIDTYFLLLLLLFFFLFYLFFSFTFYFFTFDQTFIPSFLFPRSFVPRERDYLFVEGYKMDGPLY